MNNTVIKIPSANIPKPTEMNTGGIIDPFLGTRSRYAILGFSGL